MYVRVRVRVLRACYASCRNRDLLRPIGALRWKEREKRRGRGVVDRVELDACGEDIRMRDVLCALDGLETLGEHSAV